MSEYLVIFEHNDSWGAYCPELPGVGVVGESRAEVGELIREAIELHVEDLKESGMPIPPPSVVETALVSVKTAA
jgi:predicted RNase H-like HicB family nuclease